MTILDILLGNLSHIENVKIIVATSTHSDNDVLERYLIDRKCLVYRGSEEDVLERFIKAAEENDIEGVIRICSDNPFMDWKGVSLLVQKALAFEGDYIGFRVKSTPSVLTHFGFWGEYATLNALKRVYNETEIGSAAHEHVTYHIYSHPEEFVCEWIDCPDYLRERDDIRLTVDTPEDFKNASIIYSALKEQGDSISIEDIVGFLDRHQAIKESMISSIIQNKK